MVEGLHVWVIYIIKENEILHLSKNNFNAFTSVVGVEDSNFYATVQRNYVH